MIVLDAAYQTSVTTKLGGVTTTVTTDSLFVANVKIDFTTGIMYAVVKRGTTANGPFQSNMDDLFITVNPDGSFISSDGGTWQGIVASAPALIAQLKATFDQFILASGKVSGTAI
jgi:hypothetical protein